MVAVRLVSLYISVFFVFQHKVVGVFLELFTLVGFLDLRDFGLAGVLGLGSAI